MRILLIMSLVFAVQASNDDDGEYPIFAFNEDQSHFEETYVVVVSMD